jgi:hypothetical protein
MTGAAARWHRRCYKPRAEVMVTKRILLVDQEPQITLLVRQALEKTGKYSVREAHNGELALEAARSFRPDLILVDLIVEGADRDFFYQAVSRRRVPPGYARDSSEFPSRGGSRGGFQWDPGWLQLFHCSCSHRRTGAGSGRIMSGTDSIC